MGTNDIARTLTTKETVTVYHTEKYVLVCFNGAWSLELFLLENFKILKEHNTNTH